jgi:hypothetical protein
MNRLTLVLPVAVLAVLAVAGWTAGRSGGALGAGVLAGALAGCAFTSLACLHQRHVLATRPEGALAAAAVGFLVKAAVLLGGALAFRFVAPLSARLDWRGFVIAYAAAVALVLPVGVWVAVKERGQRAATLRAH